MALDLDPSKFLEPLSADLPCGQDLDDAGDDDYFNVLARVESQLPVSFLTRDEYGKLVLFDHSKINFELESDLLLSLLERTRDLRVLALLARLAALNRDLRGLRQILVTVAGLLEAQWEAVHPRGQAGDFGQRADALQSLADAPTVILPLQHLTLFASRRLGQVSFRMLMVADGEVPPAGDDPVPDRAAIARAQDDADPEELKPLRVDLATIAGSLEKIAAVSTARGGSRGAVDLRRLIELVGQMRAFLDRSDAILAVPEAAALESSPPAQDAPAAARGTAADRIASSADAAAALVAVSVYLRHHEPSSPAEVLVRQAQTLLGKSFVDVMQILMPNHASEAGIVIGAGRGLRLSFDQLLAVPDARAAGEAQEGGAEESGARAEAPAFKAETRAEAIALLRGVGAHFRRAEPASPIPLLLDKAAGLADRDFLAILKEVLVEGRSD
ncbi:ImpA family type VI secretion system protein [Methylorubrum extorquens]|uniref:Type VI secretion system ImpA family N-terminal domain-containing protein n=1 Tax=Methylorubrum extorquens TaxID=408 RepID=A0AAX3WAX8_METEX|nr:type VI secretion system ImpA family N-terminal domain-containing protein [Methylorubrum extorquens]WHQ68580.1 type VI secretion system ImpA family N-terminal domain-containing protein [Methylorubrum extorquens]